MPKVIKVLTGHETRTVSLEPGSTTVSIKSATGKIIKKGYSPYIDEETGTWFEYDDSKATFVDSNVLAGSRVMSVSDDFILSNVGELSLNSENTIEELGITLSSYSSISNLFK